MVKDGRGESYGVEVLVRKPVGKFRGFAGYTWSQTTRQFPDLNDGEPFPYKYDLRHDFSVSGIWEVSDRVDLSMNWKYTSGVNQTFLATWFLPPSSTTLPIDVLNVSGLVLIYSGRNEFRLPDYHRLDLNVRVHKDRAWGETYWNFGLYNAYNRRNSYFLTVQPNFSEDPENPTIQVRRLTLLPVMPSINWGFRF